MQTGAQQAKTAWLPTFAPKYTSFTLFHTGTGPSRETRECLGLLWRRQRQSPINKADRVSIFQRDPFGVASPDLACIMSVLAVIAEHFVDAGW